MQITLYLRTYILKKVIQFVFNIFQSDFFVTICGILFLFLFGNILIIFILKADYISYFLFTIKYSTLAVHTGLQPPDNQPAILQTGYICSDINDAPLL